MNGSAFCNGQLHTEVISQQATTVITNAKFRPIRHFEWWKPCNALDLVIFAKIFIDMVKKCFFCGSSEVIRNGVRDRKQLYRCKACKRQFLGGRRRDKFQVTTDYVEGKQTLAQLALKYGVNDLQGHCVPSPYNCASSTRCLPSGITWRRSLSWRPQENFWTLPTA